MKTVSKLLFVIALMALIGQANASLRVGDYQRPRANHKSIPSSILDDACIIDFFGFTTGTYSGNMSWPGNSGTYYMTGYMFTNTCAPGDTLFTYCVDLAHTLNQDPYCAEINPEVVRNAYPEQVPAMAYAMTWFSVNDATDDRIAQLTLWKLSNDLRENSATLNVPWYDINNGTGYPNPGDPAVYPFVNTVYNSDVLVNLPAADRVRFVLGTSDGLAKNVINCGDDFVLTSGSAVLAGDSISIPVTIQLVRGVNALAYNNNGLGGVKVQLTATDGLLSDTEVFTNTLGQANISLKRPLHALTDATIEVCSRGMWPSSVIPCPGASSQQQLLVSRTPCSLCKTIVIQGDDRLAVDLASFDATASNDGVELTWRTASESNLMRWDIERRVTGSTSFTTLATLQAANLATGHAYRYMDQSAQVGVTYDYRLVDVDMNNVRSIPSNGSRSAGISNSSTTTLNNFRLEEAYPNPFNPETRIRFNLAEEGMTTLTVFDITGHEVIRLIDGKMAAGEHTAVFQGANLPSGVYFYKLTTGTFSETRRMILMK